MRSLVMFLLPAVVLLLATAGGADAIEAGKLTSRGFDANFAYDVLYWAMASYCAKDNINAWNCGRDCDYHKGVTNVAVAESSEQLQSYSLYDPSSNHIIVAFRGSSNIQNWVTDFTFIQENYPDCTNCKVHKGFNTAYKHSASQLYSNVDGIAKAHPDALIIVTGHSLGGAAAVFCAIDFKKRYSNTVQLWTFGQPRTGNKEFATYVANQVNPVRVTHADDPFVHMPYKDMGFGTTYLHESHEVWYSGGGTTSGFKECGDSPGVEDAACSDSTWPNANLDINAHTHYMEINQGC